MAVLAAVAVVTVVMAAAAAEIAVAAEMTPATELSADNSLDDGQRPHRSNRHSQRSHCHNSFVTAVLVSAAVFQRHSAAGLLSAETEKRVVEH